MTAAELLQAARAAGLRVRVDGDRLVVRGPRHEGDLATQLLARKTELKTLLAAPARPPVHRSHECGAGGSPCGQPARLYPCGWRCEDHAPAARERETRA